MSAMSRLTTELELVRAGEIAATQEFMDTLVRLGYEPPDDVTELDVPDELATIVECVGYDSRCTGSDYAAFMTRDGGDDWLCPNCNAAALSDYESSLSAARGW
jgi:hypothetical protein